MLTVWCVLWGDKYNSAYVYALKEMVEKNLTIEHRFICITKQKLDGIMTRNPPVPYEGWWQKIGLFAQGVSNGPSIYLDLDVVIVGNIDYLADYTDTFSAPANWAASGHGGIQSSVMCWPGKWHKPFTEFNYQIDKAKFYGDQEYLWNMLGDNWQKIDHVGSYKYHVRPNGSIPDDMRIMCFHGKPDPHEVTEPCMLPYTSTLRSLIKSSMETVSQKGSSVTA